MKNIILILSFVYLFLLNCSAQEEYDYFPEQTKDTIPTIKTTIKGPSTADSLNTLKTIEVDSIPVDRLAKDTLISKIFIIVKMDNEDELKGELLSLDSVQVKLRTSYTDLTLERKHIISLAIIFKPVETEEKLQFDTPQQSNYFLGPTAIPQTKKKLLYRNVLLLLNGFEYGFTRNITFDLGIDLSSFGGNSLQMTSGLKAAFKLTDNVHAGLGVRYSSSNQNKNFGLAYGLITLGTKETNLTLGSGYGTEGKDFFKKVYFITSGVWRLGLNLSLVSENYYSPLGESKFVYFGSYGMRAILKQNSSIDLGFMYFDNFNIAGGFVPLIGYAKRF